MPRRPSFEEGSISPENSEPATEAALEATHWAEESRLKKTDPDPRIHTHRRSGDPGFELTKGKKNPRFKMPELRAEDVAEEEVRVSGSDPLHVHLEEPQTLDFGVAGEEDADSDNIVDYRETLKEIDRQRVIPAGSKKAKPLESKPKASTDIKFIGSQEGGNRGVPISTGRKDYRKTPRFGQHAFLPKERINNLNLIRKAKKNKEQRPGA